MDMQTQQADRTAISLMVENDNLRNALRDALSLIDPTVLTATPGLRAWHAQTAQLLK